MGIIIILIFLILILIIKQMFCQRNLFQKSKHKGYSQGEIHNKKTNILYDRNAQIAQQLAAQQKEKNRDSIRVESSFTLSETKGKQILPLFFKEGKQIIHRVQENETGNIKLLSTLNNIQVVGPLSDKKQRKNKSLMGILKSNTIKSNRINSHIFQQYFQQDNQKALKQQSLRTSFQKSSNLLGQSPVKKSSSIIMIKKLKKKRQESIQKERQKYQKQLKNKKGIPIHHSQFYFNQKQRRRTQGNFTGDQNKKKLRIMTEFVKSHDPLSSQESIGRGGIFGNSEMIKIIKGSHIEKSSLQLRQLRRYSPKRNFNVKSRVKGKLFQSSVQQNDFGPWKRAITNEFDGFI